jgi:hypothetical protein
MNDEPEWNAENMNKRRGDTTFKWCGWCKHIGCGSFRYDCAISASCDLLSLYNKERKWNDSCDVVLYGKTDLRSVIDSKNYEIKQSVENIKVTKKEISVLKSLLNKSLNTPPLVNHRSANHFNIDDIVYVFVGKDFDNKNVSTGWHRGKVVNGYRHHDGCVRYVLDNVEESKGGWGSGTGRPEVLLKSEFDFFKKHKDMFRKWLLMAEKKSDKLNIEEMVKMDEVGK